MWKEFRKEAVKAFRGKAILLADADVWIVNKCNTDKLLIVYVVVAAVYNIPWPPHYSAYTIILSLCVLHPSI